MVSALGYQVLHCNGQRVSQRVLEPGRPSNQRAFASVFDLLPHLVKGDNVLTFELGNGWSSSAGGQPGAAAQPPSLFVNGTVTLPGGATIALRLGGSGWTSNVGAVTFDSVYNGEHRDLRQGAGSDWLKADYDASAWVPVMPTSVPCAKTWQGKTMQQCSGPTELAVQKIALAELMVLPPLFIRPADRSKPVSNSSCELATEGTAGASITASCGSRSIASVTFANYGEVGGSCSAGLAAGKKCSLDLKSAASTACVNRNKCTLSCVITDQEVTNCTVNGVAVELSPDPCKDTVKSLGLFVTCGANESDKPALPRAEPPAFLVDFGLNIAGVVRLKAPSAPVDGQTIVICHCEVLNHPPLSDEKPHGACWLGNPGLNANQIGSLASAESVGQRYTERRLATAELHHPWLSLRRDFGAGITGFIRCDGGENRSKYHHAEQQPASIQRAHPEDSGRGRQYPLSNTQDIFTDCPQRSERLGWLGDAGISAEEANYNFGWNHWLLHAFSDANF